MVNVNVVRLVLRAARLLLINGAAAALSLAIALALPARAETIIVYGDGQTDPVSSGLNLARPFMLEDAWGEIVNVDSLRDHFTLLYFGYTSCPDVCPTSMSALGAALEALSEEIPALQALFVSVDPKRDDPEMLRDYTAAFDSRIIGATGPKLFIDNMVGAYNARYEFQVPDPDFPDDYLIDHTASIALIGPDGLLITRFGYGLPVAEIISRVRQIAGH